MGKEREENREGGSRSVQNKYRHDTKRARASARRLVVSGQTLGSHKQDKGVVSKCENVGGREWGEKGAETYAVLSRDLLPDPVVPLLDTTTGEDGHCEIQEGKRKREFKHIASGIEKKRTHSCFPMFQRIQIRGRG